jgi:DNA-binding IclR family transcriptional regulator
MKLVADRGPLRISEIARELDLPRSSAHELVGTLSSLGCLAQSPGGQGRFDLGLLLHELGSTYLERVDLASLARQRAQEMAAECGETVHVGLLDGTEVVYLVKVDSIPVRRPGASGGDDGQQHHRPGPHARGAAGGTGRRPQLR